MVFFGDRLNLLLLSFVLLSQLLIISFKLSCCLFIELRKFLLIGLVSISLLLEVLLLLKKAKLHFIV